MTVAYVVTLRFTPGGPAVIGEWTLDRTARERWDEWVGLYATAGSDVTVRIDEVSPDGQRLVLNWENGEASGPWHR
ncbi:hypothetical protein [Streptomyces sp. NPDC001492]